MNTTNVATDELNKTSEENPGAQLARLREKNGLSQEYVAGKLHLRVKIIQLLEADEYQHLPEAVFIKGYLRAYAILLGIAPEPLLTIFTRLHSPDRKLEKALWQSRRESNRKEKAVRWVTGLVALTAMIAVGIWWQKSNDLKPVSPAATAVKTDVMPKKNAATPTQQLSSLSRMQSLFAGSESQAVEIQGG